MIADRIDLLVPLIKRYLELYPDAEHGAAHVVLSDYNLEDEFILSAIKQTKCSDLRTAEFLSQLAALIEVIDLPIGELVE
jgi:hypothetical protein